jgi:hypothetical protein
VKTAGHRQQNRERVGRWLERGRVRALDTLVILRVCDFFEIFDDLVVVTALFAASIFGNFEKVTNSERSEGPMHSI